MATFTFNKTLKQVKMGVGEILADTQEIADAVRDWQDELENLSTPNFMNTSGKGQLTATLQTGILLEFSNGWKLIADETFATNVVVVITGDFITDDGSSPFAPQNALDGKGISYDRGLSTSASITTVSGSGSSEGSRNLQSNCS